MPADREWRRTSAQLAPAAWSHSREAEATVRTWIRTRSPLLAVALLLTGCGPAATPPSSSASFATSAPAGTPSVSPSLSPATPTPPASPQPSGAARLTGPYLGQPLPGTAPSIFAAGIVSDPLHTEYSGTFSPDGAEYYFYRFSGSSPSELLVSRMVNGAWTDPQPLAIAAGYPAAEPHVTLDNQRLYFMWDRPVPEGQPSYVGGGGYYVAARNARGWSDPTYAGQGMFLSSTKAGQLYTTDMSSRQADGRTYLAQVDTDRVGRFTRYERLAIEPFLGQQAHPCVSPDGRYLLFDVDSGSHLFVSFRQTDGTWGQAVDLSSHGFDARAGGATISPDGKYVFFSLRDDIWWVDAQVIAELAPRA